MRGTKNFSTPLAMLPGFVILGIVTAIGASSVAAQDAKKDEKATAKAKLKAEKDGKKKESAKAKKEAEEKAAKKLADLIKKLGAEKTEDREKAELELKELGDKAIGALKEAYWGRDKDLRQTIEEMIKALGSDDWNIRRRATLVLADIGIPALGSLTKAQKSGDIEVQYRARILVRRIQQNNDKELVHQARTREAITRLLGNRGGEGALAILGDALSHGDRGTRRVAAKSLANIKDFPVKRLPLLTKALTDQDLWVSAYGANGLGKLGTPKAEKVLIDSLKTIQRPVPPKPKVLPKIKKVTAKKAKKKKKKPFDPFSTDPKDQVTMKNGYPIGAMPPVTSFSGGKNISAHGFRRSRVARSLGVFARAGSKTAGDAILACLADEVWLVRLEALNVLTPILKKAGAKDSDLRFPGTKKEGEKLVKNWTGKIAGAIGAGSAKSNNDVVVPSSDEDLKAFLKTLQDKDGKLLGKQAFAKL
ncbi:MAG: hypothetical protein P1V97_08390, partial [Planctomycetota bacterium]|nr:hypothetical protein [Planctomycetota bacterium]